MAQEFVEQGNMRLSRPRAQGRDLESAKDCLRGDAAERDQVPAGCVVGSVSDAFSFFVTCQVFKELESSSVQGGKPWLGDVEMTSPDLGQNSTFGDVVAQGDAAFETSIWCLPMLYQFLHRVIGKGGPCF